MFTKKRIALTFIIFLVIAGGLLFVWCKFGEDLAKFTGSLIVGLFLFCQVIVSGARATAAEKTAEEMRKTTELTEKGNSHERFKNAIEHLGDKSSSIRLGGIYALHNLARDVYGYREQASEILCAHIRETTSHTKDTSEISAVEEEKRPTIEIETILRVLFTSFESGETYKEVLVNLERVNLQGAHLFGANLYYAFLYSAYLKNVNFRSSRLQNATFNYANLQGAILVNADLQYADFSFANLYSADLESANLRNADLYTARNLEIDQLLKAKTLYMAVLPEDMDEEILNLKPQLILDSPNDEWKT